jgi:hypothetical protein
MWPKLTSRTAQKASCGRRDGPETILKPETRNLTPPVRDEVTRSQNQLLTHKIRE